MIKKSFLRSPCDDPTAGGSKEALVGTLVASLWKPDDGEKEKQVALYAISSSKRKRGQELRRLRKQLNPFDKKLEKREMECNVAKRMLQEFKKTSAVAFTPLTKDAIRGWLLVVCNRDVWCYPRRVNVGGVPPCYTN